MVRRLGHEVRLEKGAVWCDKHGLFVGSVPLLNKGTTAWGATTWRPRDQGAIEAQLRSCYGLPVDMTWRMGGIAAVGRALEQGHVARAMICALHLNMPHPPRYKTLTYEECEKLITDLRRTRLLKGEWDPSQHPRSGKPPNPGQFAEKPEPPKPTPTQTPKQGRRISVYSRISKKVKEQITKVLKDAWSRRAEIIADTEADAADAAVRENEFGVVWEAIKRILESEPLNVGEDELLADVEAGLDPPKPLEELQVEPPNTRGYDLHHLVEQNPANLLKRPTLLRYGRQALDDADNLVWVPRRKIYNSFDTRYAPEGGRVRDFANTLDWKTSETLCCA
jgi:hypothetical protein